MGFSKYMDTQTDMRAYSHMACSVFGVSVEYFLSILLKTSYASVIISAVRYIKESHTLQVLTQVLFYTCIVVNTYRFGLHFGVATID